MSDFESEDDRDSQETNSYLSASEHSYSDHHITQAIRTSQSGGKQPPLPPAASKRRGQASNSIKKPNLPLMTSTVDHDSLVAPIPRKIQPVAASKELVARKQLLLDQQEDGMSQAHTDAVEMLVGGTASATKKRGPGRPRKDGSVPVPKRKVGRPRKNPDAPNAAPKRKVGRPKKEPDPNAPPKKKPGRPRKNPPAVMNPQPLDEESTTAAAQLAVAPPPKKRGPGRPKKNPPAVTDAQLLNGESTTAEVVVPPAPIKRGPGRPRKNPSDPPKKRGRPKKDTTAAVDDAVAPPPKKKRGRPRKDQQKPEEQPKVYGGYHLGGKSVPAMLGGKQPQQQPLSRSMDEEEDYSKDQSSLAEARTPAAASALLDFAASDGSKHCHRRSDSPTEKEEDLDLDIQGQLDAATSNRQHKQTSTKVGEKAMNGVAKMPSSRGKTGDDFGEDDSYEDDHSSCNNDDDKLLHGVKTDRNLEVSETEDDTSPKKTAASSHRRHLSEQPVDDEGDEENETRDDDQHRDHREEGMPYDTQSTMGKAVHDPEPEHQQEFERCVCRWKDCESFRRCYNDIREKEGESIYAGVFCVDINGGERQANFLDAIDNNLATNLETQQQTTGQYTIARHHWAESVLRHVDRFGHAIYMPVSSKESHDLGVDTTEEANRYCTTLEEDEFGRMRPVRSSQTVNNAQWILVPNRKFEDVKTEFDAWVDSRIKKKVKERLEQAEEEATKDALIEELREELKGAKEELKEAKAKGDEYEQLNLLVKEQMAELLEKVGEFEHRNASGNRHR